jgi:hypothetical protein
LKGEVAAVEKAKEQKEEQFEQESKDKQRLTTSSPNVSDRK